MRFLGGLSQRQQQVFEIAAERWLQIIVEELPKVNFMGEEVSGVIISAQGLRIDGVGAILGQAGPSYLRPGSLLPVAGVMEFDTADIARMEGNGTLESVIVHEMAHVLGIGSLWRNMGLIQGSGTANPVFTGLRASEEFAALIQSDSPTPVPLENGGGAGTREGHWRENIFGNEIMTGFLDGQVQPFSRMTIGAMEDMGYRIDYGQADDYQLFTAFELAMMGINADGEFVQRCTACERRVRGTQPIVLSEDALVEE
ncbi:MAG: leishmanolysin-related zinc metalloendopeptidase [Bacteroidota bacterium]